MINLTFSCSAGCFYKKQKNNGDEYLKDSSIKNSCDCLSKCVADSKCLAFDFKHDKDPKKVYCSLKETVGDFQKDKSRTAGLKSCMQPVMQTSESGGKWTKF